MNIPDKAVEAAAKDRHEKVQASAQKFAARVVEADKSGKGNFDWDGTTSDYEAHVREEQETLDRGPIAWEDATEEARGYARKNMRDAVEAAAPFIAAQALRDAARTINTYAEVAYDEGHDKEARGYVVARTIITNRADELDPQ